MSSGISKITIFGYNMDDTAHRRKMIALEYMGAGFVITIVVVVAFYFGLKTGLATCIY
jgi:hypothetical protein